MQECGSQRIQLSILSYKQTGAIYMASFLSYTLSSLQGEDPPSMPNSARPQRVRDGSMDLSKVVHFTVCTYIRQYLMKEVNVVCYCLPYMVMEAVAVCIPVSSAPSAMFV